MNFPVPQPHDPLLIALIAKLAGASPQPPAPSPPSMTLREFSSGTIGRPFYDRSRRAWSLCLTALNHIRTWMGHEPTLAEMTPVTLASFVRWLAVREGRSPKTASKNYRHLRAICGYAAQLELTAPIPRLRMPAGTLTTAEEEEDVPAFTLREIEAILGQAVALGGQTDGRRDADLWVALVLSLYNTALRIAAALSLRWADYDAANKCFDVRRSTQKTKKAQCVGITAQTAAYLERLRTPAAKAEDPIWPWPAGKDSQRRLCRFLRGRWPRPRSAT